MLETYVWLHQALYSCGFDIAIKNDYAQLLRVVLRRIEMFLRHRITLVLVFDGAPLPSKENTENKRELNRQDNLQKGKELLAAGDKTEANKFLTRSLDVTPLMAHKVIKMAQEKGIECIVAPYEADAQLAYLSKIPIFCRIRLID